jgi:SEL1 protein
MALDTNAEAYLPVMLSLCKLYAKSLWYAVSGGSNKSLLLWGTDAAEDEHWYFGKARDEFAKRWRGRKGSSPPKTNNDAANGAVDTPATIDSDDPVQWAEDQRTAEIERARAEEEAYERGDFFSGDFLAAGDPRRHQRYDENGHEIPDTEEFWETMFLVALVIMISCLIFVRARFVAQAEAARRRHHDETAARAGGNGHIEGQGDSGPNGAPPTAVRAGSPARTGQAEDQGVRPDQDEIPEIGLFPPGEEPPDL